MPASASMPPTPQPTTPRPLIIVVCESVPTSVSGIVDAVVAREHALGEVFEVHLVDDADAGRHDLEGVERLLAPLEELVALAVALEFEVEVLLQARRAVPAKSTCTEWSTTRSTGTSGSIIFGFLPRRATAERIAARSTSSGTPVKSCSTMRATTNGISSVRGALASSWPASRTSCFAHLLAVAIAQHGLEHDADGNRAVSRPVRRRPFPGRAASRRSLVCRCRGRTVAAYC